MGGREKNTYSSFSAHLTLISDTLHCACFGHDHVPPLNFSHMSGPRKGGRFAKSKPAGSHKSLKVAQPRRNPVPAVKQAACEASTFVNGSVSSIHQHIRAQGVTSRAVHVKAAAEAEAKAERAKAIGAVALIKDGASAPSTDYHPGGSHTPGGGGDGSSSKSRLSNHGGNQP